MISEILANLSLNAFFPSLFVVIIYFMVGLRTDDLARNLFILIAECILVQLGSTAFALLSASLVRNCEWLHYFIVFRSLNQYTSLTFWSWLHTTVAEASLMANGSSIFLFLTAGYALLKPPVYVNWIRFSASTFHPCEGLVAHDINYKTHGNSLYFLGWYISLEAWLPLTLILLRWTFKYGFRIIAISQFRGRVFSCEGVTGNLANQVSCGRKEKKIVASKYLSLSVSATKC
jgi:hypothetical protein